MGAGWCGDVFQPHGGSWASVCHRKLRAWPTCLRPLKQAFDQFSPRQREHRAPMKQQFADRGQIMVALSHFVARDFQHFHGIRPEQIRIIYNGVDPERFSPQPDAELRQPLRRQLGVAPDEVLALTVAHNFPLKGVPSLLRAMSRLVADRRPIRLAVVGGKRLGRWRRTAARLGLGDRVRFVGSVESSAPYYAAADFCVHPTWYDPCSLVLLEAAASGLPVVTTRECNGVAELFQDGVDALLVSHPGEVDELAQKMNVLLDEAVRRSAWPPQHGVSPSSTPSSAMWTSSSPCIERSWCAARQKARAAYPSRATARDAPLPDRAPWQSWDPFLEPIPEPHAAPIFSGRPEPQWRPGIRS